MLKRHAQLFEGLFTATDLLVVSAAWVVSYWIRFDAGILPVYKGVPELGQYLKIVLFVWLIWAFVFRRMGLYRPMRGVSAFRETLLLIRANALCVLLLLSVTYLFREKDVEFSRAVFLIFWGTSTAMVVTARTLTRRFLRSLRRRGYNQRYVLVVGAGDLAHRVAARIVGNADLGMEILGLLARDLPLDGYSSEIMADENGNGVNGTNGASYVHSAKASSRGRRRFLNGGRVFRRAFPSSGGFSKRVGALRLRVLASRRAQAAANGRRFPILGSYRDLPDILARQSVDQVIIALPLCDHALMNSVIASIGDTMVDVKIVPDLRQFIQLGSLIEEFDGVPVISLASTPLSGTNRVVKRMFDLGLSTVLFILLFPLMAFIGLLVKLTSRGPVFFAQERVGLDGRMFSIYKFRTMSVDAERDGARFAVRHDPRVTTLGRILRKFNLDELPQLYNVMRGHMSLVGPRPERPVFIKEFRSRIPKYMLRHKVQAGMTGWAQVNGWRGNTSIERRIEHDLYYIENWSLGLDLKILGLTVIHAFRDRNAY